MQLSAEEEAKHNRVGRMQKWCFSALQVASEREELLPGTDCMQLSQLLTASQWGLTFMWQKHLIPTEQLQKQAVLKHCTDLMPFCSAGRRGWLEEKMLETLEMCSTVKSPPAAIATAQGD